MVSKKRLHLTMNVRDWIAKSEAIPFFHFAPIDNDIALASVFLPEPLHQDPADRIIIATALSKGATLVTKDEKILDYPSVKAIWEQLYFDNASRQTTDFFGLLPLRPIAIIPGLYGHESALAL